MRVEFQIPEDIMLTPEYTHDCTVCIFIGSRGGRDVYVHPGNDPSIVVRYGSEPRENQSGAVFVLSGNFFREALNTPPTAMHWTNIAASVLASYAFFGLAESERIEAEVR